MTDIGQAAADRAVTATAAPPSATSVNRREKIVVRGFAALVLLMLAVLVEMPLRTPDPTGIDGAETEFSAGRAQAHIAAIARTPHPTGSAALAEARQYVTQTLGALGAPTRVTERTACRPLDQRVSCGRVSNVSAVFRGREPGQTVVLVAHLDSVDGGPGASDDGVGVATAIEVARALTAGPGVRNDVLLLFTDGEESGLLGAQAALDASLLPDPDASVVINLEARGTSGPAVMFQTGDRNTGVVRSLRDDPAGATSFADAVYRLLPHDTDFTEFRDAGYTGLNFAVFGGSARYHMSQDDLANVDSRSLQDMGDAVLAATRALAGNDLTEVTRGDRSVYFPVLGQLVSYPRLLADALTAIAVVALAASLWWARRRGALRLRSVAATAGALLAALFCNAILGLLGWRLLTLARPDYLGFVHGDPYRPGPMYVGFAIVAVAVTVVWLGAVARPRGATELCAAGTAVLTSLAVAGTVVAPGASYVAIWPALAGAAAVVIASAATGDSRRFLGLRTLAWLLPGAVALAVLGPVTLLLFSATGLSSVAVPMVAVGLLTGILLSGPARWVPGRRAGAAVGTLLLLAGSGTVAADAAADEVDNAHPRQVSLLYGVDADTGTATWLSPYPVPDDFVDQYVDGDGDGDGDDDGDGRSWSETFPLLRAPHYRSGTAGTVPVPAPVVEPGEVEPVAEGRRLRLRLRADSADATLLALYVGGGGTVVNAEIDGQQVSGGVNRPAAAGAWQWGMTYVGPSQAGVDVRLVVSGTAPVRVRVLAQSPGLPPEALGRPMPTTVTAASAPAVLTLSARTVVL